jgi:hypothetical protein|tara:strand:+ start:246 stop:587 length:342 start_codon:yes stop_codon:yes gene_type:complete
MPVRIKTAAEIKKMCSKAGQTLSTSKNINDLSVAGANLAYCRWGPPKTPPKKKTPPAKREAKPRSTMFNRPKTPVSEKSPTQTSTITALRNIKKQYVGRSPYFAPYINISDID